MCSCGFYLMALWLCGWIQSAGGLSFYEGSSAELSGCSIYDNFAGSVSAALRFFGSTASLTHAFPLSAAARCAALALAARLAGGSFGGS